jgi:single-stranded-DNA-specific exonuclease
MIDSGPPVGELSALVLASPGWHPGVVGVVASKIVERFYLPTVVLCIDGDEAQGSARSTVGLHLFDALTECNGLLRRYGGHALAAGLRLSASRVGEFREKFCRVAAERMSPESRIPTLALDVEAPLSALTLSLMREIDRLEPFGQANPEPLFAGFNLKVAGQVQRMGAKGQHLSFWVRQDDTSLRAVAFGWGDRADALQSAGVCSLAYRANLNEYRGTKSLELRVEDLRIGPESRPGSAVLP